MLQPQTIAPQGPSFSPLVVGYWRSLARGMTAQQLAPFIEHNLSLGLGTADHAAISGL